MIENRLRVIAAERYLTAKKISKDTGITESTLSKMMNNKSKMISYSVLNALCNYLKITPNDFFEYKEDE